MSQPFRVLIAGAGIAGAVFANCLFRAYGNRVEITIVERSSALRLTGASVHIRNAAVDVIKWMGVEEAIRKHSTNEEGMQWSDIQSITSEYEIFRGDLIKVFFGHIPSQVKLIFNESVGSYKQDEAGVRVTLKNSLQHVDVDLLVAAEGLHSKIRGIIHSTDAREHIFDQGFHVAYFTIKRDLLQGSRLAKVHESPNGCIVLIRPDPAGHVRAHLMVETSESDTEARKRLHEALASNEAYMDVMDELFSGVGWLAAEVLEEMRKCDDFYCSFFAQTRVSKLADNRVVLLGDAGYAQPGFGTSLAIIGGYVLAGELISANGNVQHAVQAYEDLMLPFAQQVHNDKDKLDSFNRKQSLPDYPWPKSAESQDMNRSSQIRRG